MLLAKQAKETAAKQQPRPPEAGQASSERVTPRLRNDSDLQFELAMTAQQWWSSQQLFAELEAASPKHSDKRLLVDAQTDEPPEAPEENKSPEPAVINKPPEPATIDKSPEPQLMLQAPTSAANEMPRMPELTPLSEPEAVAAESDKQTDQQAASQLMLQAAPVAAVEMLRMPELMPITDTIPVRQSDVNVNPPKVRIGKEHQEVESLKAQIEQLNAKLYAEQNHRKVERRAALAAMASSVEQCQAAKRRAAELQVEVDALKATVSNQRQLAAEAAAVEEIIAVAGAAVGEAASEEVVLAVGEIAVAEAASKEAAVSEAAVAEAASKEAAVSEAAVGASEQQTAAEASGDPDQQFSEDLMAELVLLRSMWRDFEVGDVSSSEGDALRMGIELEDKLEQQELVLQQERLRTTDLQGALGQQLSKSSELEQEVSSLKMKLSGQLARTEAMQAQCKVAIGTAVALASEAVQAKVSAMGQMAEQNQQQRGTKEMTTDLPFLNLGDIPKDAKGRRKLVAKESEAAVSTAMDAIEQAMQGLSRLSMCTSSRDLSPFCPEKQHK